MARSWPRRRSLLHPPWLLHLAQIVKFYQTSADEGFVRELNEEALARARVYLAQVTESLQALDKQPRLSISSSVKIEKDVAATLVGIAERGDEETGSCDLIAISTHGLHGLERWVMGSVTDRVLSQRRCIMI